MCRAFILFSDERLEIFSFRGLRLSRQASLICLLSRFRSCALRNFRFGTDIRILTGWQGESEGTSCHCQASLKRGRLNFFPEAKSSSICFLPQSLSSFGNAKAFIPVFSTKKPSGGMACNRRSVPARIISLSFRQKPLISFYRVHDDG